MATCEAWRAHRRRRSRHHRRLAVGVAHPGRADPVSSDGVTNPPEKRLLLPRGRYPDALELTGDSNVGKQAHRVFVKMKEGSGPAVEGAAALLPKAREPAERFEQGLQFVECLRARVFHLATACPSRNRPFRVVPILRTPFGSLSGAARSRRCPPWMTSDRSSTRSTSSCAT